MQAKINNFTYNHRIKQNTHTTLSTHEHVVPGVVGHEESVRTISVFSGGICGIMIVPSILLTSIIWAWRTFRLAKVGIVFVTVVNILGLTKVVLFFSIATLQLIGLAMIFLGQVLGSFYLLRRRRKWRAAAVKLRALTQHEVRTLHN